MIQISILFHLLLIFHTSIKQENNNKKLQTYLTPNQELDYLKYINIISIFVEKLSNEEIKQNKSNRNLICDVKGENDEILCLKVFAVESSYHTELNGLKYCRHPNIVQYLYAEKFNGVKLKGIIIMEKLNFIVNYATINGKLEEIIKLLYDILKAIFFLHNINIAHGDIKLSNIMGNKTNDLTVYKLIDFNLSVRFIEKNQVQRIYSGTNKYRAPEVEKEKIFTTKSDIFSLGAVGFYLLNGLDNETATKKTVKTIFRDFSGDYLDEISNPINPKLKFDIKNKKTTCNQKCTESQKPCNEKKKYDKLRIYNFKIGDYIQTTNQSKDSKKYKLYQFIGMCLEPFDTRKWTHELVFDQKTKDLFEGLWKEEDFISKNK